MKRKIKPFKEGIDFRVIRGQKSNKKVRNATKIAVNDVEFKSKLEGYVYFRLKQLGLDVQYEQNSYTLIHPFTFDGQKIRAITYKPDFVHEHFIIECKGNKTDAWKIREKLVKRRFAKDFPNKKFFIVSSMSGFEDIVEDLLKIVEENESIKKHIRNVS